MPSVLRHFLIALTASLLLAIPASAVAQKTGSTSTGWTPGVAFNYSAQESKLSQPRFETEQTELRLPAFDGTELYIEVTKPKGTGRFPVILEASPYHGTLADREGTRILPDPRGEDGKSIGLTGYFAPRGYAVVMFDLRGTGHSRGCLNQLGLKDARDLKQVVEWAASQSWSNGKVGMTGHSYVGSTPSVAAAQRPKGLATIVPSAGLASMYHHQFQAGVPYMLQWTGVQWSYNYLSVIRKLPPVGNEPVQNANTGDDFGNNTEDTGCGAPDSALTAGEAQLSGQYVDWHLARDWSDGATKANIPVFAVHGVNDNAARVGALDWFFERENAADKLWLGQWDHGSGCCPNRRGMQWTHALHAWFDKHLAGRTVSTGPPVEMFMSDDQSFSVVRSGARTQVLNATKREPATKTLTFYPEADGTMSRNRPAEGSASFVGTKEGFSEFAFGDPTWRTGRSFATKPFLTDTVMAGVPWIELAASVTAPRVHLIANLLDQDPEGKRRRISQFAINPELRDGIEQRKNVTPGQRYDMHPPGFAMAHNLRKGHRLVLQVTTSDPDKAPFFAEDPNVTVFTGFDATRFSVPVVESPTLAADNVPLFPAETINKPPHEAISETITTGAPGVVLREDSITTTNVEFELLAGQDNARMDGIAKPSSPADLDLYLMKEENGEWVEVTDGRNDGSTTEELITTGRLTPGKYSLQVHNFAGAPGNEVQVDLTFFGQGG